MQLQLRRRYTSGVTLNVNYTLAKNTGDIWADNATQSDNYRTLRDKSLDAGTAPFDVRHVFQAFGTYDLPFGRIATSRSATRSLNAIAGGWTLGTVVTAQSGTPFRLTQRTPDRQRPGLRRRAHERTHGRGDPEHDQDPSGTGVHPVLGRSEADRAGRPREPGVPGVPTDARASSVSSSTSAARTSGTSTGR